MKLGGGIAPLNNGAEYGEDNSEANIMSMSAMPVDVTPTDTILQDEDGYITSGKWECENGITVELADNVLTISGNGVPGDDVKNLIGKTICKSSNYKVKCIINSGITEITGALFAACKGLSSLEIPESVTSIESFAFRNCSSLSNIEISEGVTSIGHGVFQSCSSLSRIEIPESVTSIGGQAFDDCSSLSRIEIPGSVTSIGYLAFYGCSSLSSIKVAEDNKVYDSRDNCNAVIETKTNELIVGCYNTTIPGSVTSIGDSAFEDCSNLSSIEIPEGVTSIESWAFRNCSSLSRIEISESVTSISRQAFDDCSNLSSIKVAEDNKVYDSRDNCNAVIRTKTNELIVGCYNTIIPGSVASIGDNAFNGCSSLSRIEIPEGVTNIGDDAF